jgi:signal transduction histidine kinase
VRRTGRTDLSSRGRPQRQLITGLLLLARSENEVTGRLLVDMADLVTHVMEQTAPEAARAGVTIHGQAGDAPTTGDALLLERLVHNLVENGIRHNTGPGGRVKVTSRTRGDGQVEVEVRNTGPVVPHHEIAAVFEPFRRLPASRQPTAKGAGLGLPIVRSVAHAHGGQATARPRDGGGLVVTVTLPVAVTPSRGLAPG